MIAGHVLPEGALMRKAALISIIVTSWAIFVLSSLSAAALAATASFTKTDTAMEGGWVGTYGADGYLVSQDANIMRRSSSADNPTGHGQLC
jgi:hypothetical protein